MSIQSYSSGYEWQYSNPEGEGLNISKIKILSDEFRNGMHGYVDAFLLIKNGKIVHEEYYENDYAELTKNLKSEQSKILSENYGDAAKPIYNYFDPKWHPYYKDTDLHTIQSVSKSVTSALIGIAIERGEINGLNEKIAQYFPNHSSQFMDPLKSKITIEDLLTMRAGIKWDESSHAYTNPMNNAASMENSNNWIDYILSLPMEYKPGEKFVYNSGITVLLSHILHEASGMQANEYAEKYLFNKLGIQDYFWKKTPNNLTDAEGGLYLSTRDFAKIGMLYLNDGRWNGSPVITNEWVELTMSPDTDIEESSRKYGYQWWLVPYENNQEKWMYSGSGYGGQYLLIVPEYQLVMVFNGWNIFDIPRPSIEYLSQRVLEAIQ
tara:strand:+ start:8817 stop:9953 length:1137 start_codon:yes stop_codon:yes gene_type:complete